MIVYSDMNFLVYRKQSTVTLATKYLVTCGGFHYTFQTITHHKLNNLRHAPLHVIKMHLAGTADYLVYSGIVKFKV